MCEVVSIGECLIDFIPGPVPRSYLMNPGGAPANVAVALARQGIRAGFVGLLGDDDFGDFLAATLAEEKVQLLVSQRSEEAVTTLAFVTLDEEGERSFTFVRRPGADILLTPGLLPREKLAAARLVNAGSVSLSAEPAATATKVALVTAKSAGRLVAFDFNYRPLLWPGREEQARKALLTVLSQVDLLKLSGEEADLLGGEASLPELAEEYDIAAIVVTRGADGAGCLLNGRFLEEPTRKVPVVDTTGAGDAFWGGFLATLVKGGVRTVEDLEAGLLAQALRVGNVAGELCVQKKGAMTSLPYAAEVDLLLASRQAGEG